jgi:integrase
MAKVNFTAPRVNGFKCPPDKKQAFLWDATAPGLGLRATPNGKPSYVFQGVYQGKDIRLTVGSPSAWSIPGAQDRARELQRLIDDGKDPRDLKREAIAATEAKKAAEVEKAKADVLDAVTTGEVWALYIEDRRPVWGVRHLDDHLRIARAGGEVAKRGIKPNADGSKALTTPGPIYPLLALPLRDLTPPVVEAWAAQEAKTRPTQARLTWRCLKAFLNWCAEHPDYARLLSTANPAKTKRAREALGKAKPKDDALQREQLAVWFDAVRKLSNHVIAAYLQALLLTGARPGEVLTLRWEDINTQWKGITIRDKVEGERVIPLTPFVAHLLEGLPRRNEWVFSSTRELSLDDKVAQRRERRYATTGRAAPAGDVTQASTTGHLTVPRGAHTCACTTAGLEGLTLHGLRRSFSSLTEWLEVPAGVVAQIQGHKPSATAEKHYKRRPLDLLRVHHERIEAWILEQAGIAFDASKA